MKKMRGRVELNRSQNKGITCITDYKADNDCNVYRNDLCIKMQYIYNNLRIA